MEGSSVMGVYKWRSYFHLEPAAWAKLKYEFFAPTSAWRDCRPGYVRSVVTFLEVNKPISSREMKGTLDKNNSSLHLKKLMLENVRFRT